ncbi:hypothetical protein GGR50DRAFT_696883 [Xylaria sp. CBS 124048]|nr:hypothetical protein GGR50DRAFT_696883 [Xylaria sp. CBS 124048]
MSGLAPKHKTQDVLQRGQKRRSQRQHSSNLWDFDPLAMLDDEFFGTGVTDGNTVMSTTARRRVDEWLDHSEFDTADVTQPEIEDTLMGVDDVHSTHIGPNTLDIVSNILSKPQEDDEPSHKPPLPPPIPLTGAAERIIDAARQRDAIGLNDIDDIDDVDDPSNVVEDSSETLSNGIPYPTDKTQEFKHNPQPSGLSAFHTMLAIWESEHGVTRHAHAELVELFQLASSLKEIQMTPKSQQTPIARVIQSLPLWKTRKVSLNLDHTALPSRTNLKEDLIVFDLGDIVTSIILSPYMQRHMHRGMAHLIDGMVENPWQANWWGESVRTTSGQFFSYSDGSPIFPADFISWRCSGRTCQTTDSTQCSTHFGRIRYCGWDKRASMIDTTNTPGAPDIPVIIVQKVADRDHLSGCMADDIQSAPFSHRTIGRTELIISEDDEVLLSPSDIISRIPDVLIDYHYDPHGSIRPGPLTSDYTVRLIYNTSRRQYRVVKLSSPHRAELEIRAYGRQHFIDKFAMQDVISLPFQMFIDAFGLYRNMYRSLMGIYLTPEFLPADLRSKRANIFPLTLGPHGAELTDILAGLFHIRHLDGGAEVVLPDEKRVFVCSFVGCITGDMPSQQKLSGCLSPRATVPCRYCLVRGDDKANLDFDVVNRGKYHMQIEIDRRQIASQAKSNTQEESQLRELGLHNDKSLIHTLEQLFPALDMIRSRPIDAAHSEYQGLSRILHGFMFKDGMSILTSSAVTEACAVYQSFTAPPRWGRLQSPKRHLDSWRMQELARGSVILPILLRCWLQPGHIRDDCINIIPRIAPEYFTADDFLVPTANFTATDWLVSAAWCFARSIFTIFGRHPDIGNPQAKSLLHIIQTGRKAIQFLCQVNASASQEKSITRASKAAGKTASKTTGLISSRSRLSSVMHMSSQASQASEQSEQSGTNCGTEYTDADIDDAATSTFSNGPVPKRRARPQDKAQSYINMKSLPNIHTGIHLVEIVREYGSCRLTWTLGGEDKHREYKKKIVKTNKQNPAATLLNHENKAQTLRFTVEGSFKTLLPEVHGMFQSVKEKCPLLARSIVPLLDIYEDEDYNADEDRTSTSHGDMAHKHPQAQLHVQSREVTKRDNPMLNITDVRRNSSNIGIVGLPQVVSEHIWMVPGPDNSFLFVDYDVSFM